MYFEQWSRVFIKYCFIIKILFSDIYLRPSFSKLFNILDTFKTNLRIKTTFFNITF